MAYDSPEQKAVYVKRFKSYYQLMLQHYIIAWLLVLMIIILHQAL